MVKHIYMMQPNYMMESELFIINKKPRGLITGRQGMLQLWKLTQNSRTSVQ